MSPATRHRLGAPHALCTFLILARAAAGMPGTLPCEGSEHAVGVHLPAGSPPLALTVRDAGEGGVMWAGTVHPASTATKGPACAWAARVGGPSGDASGVPALPANRLLRFDFGPPGELRSFEYQLCRGPGAPFGTFRCPQDGSGPLPSSFVLFVYDPDYRGEAGMRIVLPSVMEGLGRSFDDLVPTVRWTLPYDLDQACGRTCGQTPGLVSACDAARAEASTPYLRRALAGTSSGGLQVNPGAPWVIRTGRTVRWEAADLPGGVSLAFSGGACLEVQGALEVHGLSLTAVEPGGPWRGVTVVAGGHLRLKASSVSYAGDLRQPVIAGAIHTVGGEVVLDGAALTENWATGLYVAGAGGRALVRGCVIRGNRIPLSTAYSVSGIEAADGARVEVRDGCVVEQTRGAGMTARGAGTVVLIEEGAVAGNAGPGVQALGGAEVFLGLPDGVSQVRVRDNAGGGLVAIGGHIVAGVARGGACARYCGHTLTGNASGGSPDAVALAGGSVYAEANYWGVPDASALVLVADPASQLSVLPLLPAPPSAAPTAAPAAGSPAPSGQGPPRLAAPAPNPARARAHVRYELAAPGAARLSLHDALGREVAVLAEGDGVAGEQGVSVDVSGLPPGVYLLRLRTGAETSARLFTVAR